MNPWADQPYYSYTPPYEVTKYNLTYTKRIFAELNSGLDHMGDPSMLSHPSMSPQLPLEQELRFNDKLNYVQKLDVPNYIFFSTLGTSRKVFEITIFLPFFNARDVYKQCDQ